MSEALRNPFAELAGYVPDRVPAVGRVTLVVQGLALPKSRPLRRAERARIFDGETPEERAEQAAQLTTLRERVAVAARRHRLESSEAGKARKRAYEERNKGERDAYRRDWEARNLERRRAYKAAWARKARLLRPELRALVNERCKAYQAKNREQLLAKRRERRAEKRAAMTPQELDAERQKLRERRASQREKVNAKKRERYARLKAQKLAAAGGRA